MTAPRDGAMAGILWWTGLAGIALPMLLPGGILDTRPIVLASHVVVDAARVVIAIGWATGAVCWMARLLIIDDIRPAIPPIARILRRLRGALAIAVVAASLLTSALGIALGDQYHVLDPPGEGGCRIIVSTQSRTTGASGRIYLARPGTLRPIATGGAWNAPDDPDADPAGDGTWTLHWNHRTARLRLWTRAAHDRKPDHARTTTRQSITCPT